MTSPFPIYQSSKGTLKQVPSIYAIELSSACDLQCPMCLRTTDMARKSGLLDYKLLLKMRDQGDFEGSTYIELQQAGEPTMHPLLYAIIEFLKKDVGVLIGLSTHGLNMRKTLGAGKGVSVAQALCQLDHLTVSIDSLDPATYHTQRYPAKLPDLMHSLAYLWEVVTARLQMGMSIPSIEFQLVKTELGGESSGDVDALTNWMHTTGWSSVAVPRVIDDCFSSMQGRTTAPSHGNDICLNPWTSVNINTNGDVLSCCYIFDPKPNSIHVYGNVNDAPLSHIWTSPNAEAMRSMHIEGSMEEQCAKCNFQSPVLIHDGIVSRMVRLRRRSESK